MTRHDMKVSIIVAFCLTCFVVAAIVFSVRYNQNFNANCLKYHTRETFILVGKALVPTTEKVCDLWRK
jgi:hypothetical protein